MTDTTISLHYAVEIDCSDITTDSNVNIGLYAGRFKWITDRPGYAATSGLKLITRGFLNSMKYVITRGFSTSESQSTWKQGIIKSLGQPNRLINILSGGDYGTLSGFTFEVDNTSVDGSGTGDNFSTVLFENDYFVISRKVRFYVIIGDVFYNAWSGIVTSTDYDELSYKFQCQDDSKTIHKPLPLKVMDKYLFPNVSSQDEGKTIPVCLGLVEHAELLNVLSMTDALDILKKESAVYRLAPILSYTEGTKTLTILTGEINFSTNYLKNYYLKHVLEGDGQVVKITSSSSGYSAPFGIYYAVLILEEILTEEPVLYTLSGTTPGSWVEIYNFDSSYIASNDSINEYYENDNGQPVLEYWNKDYNNWSDVSETIQYYSNIKISNSIVFPGLKLLSKSVNFDGTYTKYSVFTPKSVIYDGYTKTPGTVITTDLAKGTDYSKLRDKDYDTYETFAYITADLSNSTVKVYFLVEFPDNMKKEDYDEIYLLMDSSIESDENVSNYDYDFNVAVGDSLRLKTFITKIECDVYAAQNLTAGTPLETILIPEIYYNTGTDNQTLFNSLKSNLLLTSFYDNAIKFRAYPFLKLELEHYIPANLFSFHNTTLNFRQVCFVAAKTVNLTSEKVYTRVNGEKIGTNTTDNIAMIFQHILETYDEINLNNINYNSLVSNRSGWKAGRQITEKKSSKEYLQELCRQSFTCIYPTIDGKRGVKAFRDDTSFSSLVHSTANGTIIADSISRFELSDINQVYNSFDIKYSFNPASEKFEKHIYIHNPEKSSFPHRLATEGTSNAAAADPTRTFTSMLAYQKEELTFNGVFLLSDTSNFEVDDFVSFVDSVTLNKSFYYGKIVSITENTNMVVEFENDGNWIDNDTTSTGLLYDHYSSIPIWKTYAGGLTNYTTASSHWTACHHSYERTGKISPLPESLGLCHWFVEENNFYPNSPGDNSTAHKYLAELIEWTTRQKEIVEYQIPITAANVAIELLTPVTFSDLKYTNSTNRQGYITKIKINPEVDTISIEATLEPADIDDLTGCNIQETGLSADTIQETGSQTNDYQETGLC